MTYIIFKDSAFKRIDVEARKSYIYNTFPGVYRIEGKEYEDRIELQCYAILDLDIVILVGHFVSVCNYIVTYSNYVKCNILIIISCFTNKIPLNKLGKVRKIYIAKTINDEAIRYDGGAYGFEFQITDSELTFYKAKKYELDERINKSFNYSNKNKPKLIFKK